MATLYIAKGDTDLTGNLGTGGDNVIFGEGNQYITGGLNTTGALTNGLANVSVMRRFTGRIGGGSAGPLRLQITGTLWYDAGGGWLQLYPNGTADTAAKILYTGQGRLEVVSGGTVTNFEQDGGASSFITGDVVVTNAWLGSGESNIKYHATGITLLWVVGGKHTIERKIADSNTAYFGAGYTIFQREDTSATVPTATSCVLNVADGAVVDWAGGAVGTVNLLGPRSRFFVSKANIDLTIGTVLGDPRAIAASGLPYKSSGTVTTKTGNTVTATTVTPKGGYPESAQGGPSQI